MKENDLPFTPMVNYNGTREEIIMMAFAMNLAVTTANGDLVGQLKSSFILKDFINNEPKAQELTTRIHEKLQKLLGAKPCPDCGGVHFDAHG
jgi:hypothetical protein